ncbi:uncharacterized protein LOC105845069 isoform X3 [Hydra vulgaris]|uniref:uncharacterized protein LOC105845069 isoform X3 n=1 Tax=Hydra vulgaris TaxID=6087 RepID=UPI001F5EA276|nr:uncharacterized protein LOC105845069 isoform X3 [Hydra vulgaris]
MVNYYHVLKTICILICCKKLKGDIFYYIEPYGLPNCYFYIPIGSIQVTYNCSEGHKFLLVPGVNGNPGTVSFKSAVYSDRYLRHYSFIFYLQTLFESNSGPDDRSFYIQNSTFDSYFLIQSTNFPNWFLWRNGFQFQLIQDMTLAPESRFTFFVCDLNVKTIRRLTRYSVVVVIDASVHIQNVSKSFVVKYGKNSDFKLYNVSGNSVNIDLLHNYTIHTFTAGAKNEFGMYVFGNTSDYQIDENSTHIDGCIHGLVNRNMLNLSFELIGYGYNITVEYFFPPFVTFMFESVPYGFIKTTSNHYKYIFYGYFETIDVITHNITLKLHKTKCGLPIEIPARLTFQNNMGVLKTITMSSKNNVPCFDIPPIIQRDQNALPEYYGRGIYVDTESSHIYLCMNQHVESKKTACYYSNKIGNMWTDMDVRVGAVIGHHSQTKELYAINRNQKTYLYFDLFYKKWLAISNLQFNKTALKNLNTNKTVNLEGDEEKILYNGLNQWMGNVDGLFYRNESSGTWLLKAKWFL